jgi:phosphopantetheinyl transferase
VRKEAFVKANGSGLSIDLDRFDVTIGDEQPILSRMGWDEEGVGRWSIRPIEIGSSYVAAIAVEGHDWRPNYWNARPLTDRIISQISATSSWSDDTTMNAEGWLNPSE